MRVYLAFCGAAIGLSVLALIDPRAAAFGAGMGLAWLVLALLGALLIGRLMDGDVRDGGTGRHDAGLADQSVSDAAPSVVNRNGYPRQNGTGVQS